MLHPSPSSIWTAWIFCSPKELADQYGCQPWKQGCLGTWLMRMRMQNNELTWRACCCCCFTLQFFTLLCSSPCQTLMWIALFAPDIEWNTPVRCTEAYWVNCLMTGCGVGDNAAVKSVSWSATDVIPTWPPGYHFMPPPIYTAHQL